MTDAPKPFYITTAIDYVNAPPHLGHAYEKIATDVMARFQRLMGRDVFFLTGTDEHGIKIEKTAQGLCITPKEHVDNIAGQFQDTWKLLNISYDRFVRTTEAQHYSLVQDLWRKMLAKGDIYKHAYTGLYCSGCETFMTARDLDEDGQCPNHLRKPEPVTEENYFFKLTAYKEQLKQHIESNPSFVQPDFRRQEVLKFLEEVEDISVSRSILSVSWGIPVPDDDQQRIYVWIDALSNYLTGVDYGASDDQRFKTYWPADYHIIGKDILRFHAVYWPAMLLSAGIELPKCVFAHGFININDAKISKSVGNVISPAYLMERFELPNPDPIRYYLMTCATFGQDGSFTEDDFKNTVNADLANNLGNLLNRSLNMTLKYFDGKVPEAKSTVDAARIAEIQSAYAAFDFAKALQLILSLVDDANKLINEREPWNLFKNGQLDVLAETMYTILDTLRAVALMLSPVTPALSTAIWEQLGYATPLIAESWASVQSKALPVGQAINLQGPILPRLDSELAGASKKG